MSEILGVLFAILVATLVIPKFADFQRTSNDNTRAAITAQQQKQIYTAGSTYIQQNAVVLQAAASPTVPATITVAMLQVPGIDLLPPSFAAVNPYGQTWQIQVLEPTANNLQALVYATGGTPIQDKQAGKIAAIVGASGGLIPLNDSGIYAGGAANAFGTSSGWTIPTANYTAITGGTPAALLSFNNGQLVSNYLYRNAVPGQPQLNKMGTSLDMAGNNLNNAGQVNTGVLTTTGNANVGGTLGIAGNATVGGALGVVGNMTAGGVTTTGLTNTGKLQVNDVVIETAPCSPNGLVAKDSTGFLLSCQLGLWKRAVKAPNSYRYMFTSSQTWTVPVGVASAFVTMAGGGGSGYGWRVSQSYNTGPSGGYVFSQPVNLIPGETLQVTVGKGGISYQPYATTEVVAGTPYFVYTNPAGDNGLAGYPGESSLLVSPSMGTLMRCDGGSGASSGRIDNFSGSIVAGNMGGGNNASGYGATFSPHRVAAGPYATMDGAGACGPSSYGIGNYGSLSYNVTSGVYPGGKTPFGYGSGGDVQVWGCYVSQTYIGLCVFPVPARDGVVFIDVLY